MKPLRTSGTSSVVCHHVEDANYRFSTQAYRAVDIISAALKTSQTNVCLLTNLRIRTQRAQRLKLLSYPQTIAFNSQIPRANEAWLVFHLSAINVFTSFFQNNEVIQKISHS